MKVQIFTDRNLFKNILNGWSEEKMIQGKIKTLTGRTFVVEQLDENDTILKIKQKIEGICQ